MTKKILPLINKTYFLLLLALITTASYAQTFTTLTSIPGTNQEFDGGIAFELNGSIYAGAGFYGKKIHQYNIGTDTWSAKNDLPGSVYSRTSAQAFTLNGKAYVLNGDDINPSTFTSTKLLDFYEYNESGDTWVSKPAPPFTYRRGAAVFVIDNKAYLVGGYDNTNTLTNTTWEYDGTTWTQKANVPTTNLGQASSFVLNNLGYVACGLTKVTTTSQTNLLFQYNPSTDTWTSKAAFPGAVRAGAMGFSAGGQGFCGLGSNVNSSFQFVYHNDFYGYDPASNSWSLVPTTFPGTSRQSAMAVSYNNKAYIGAGWSFLGGTNSYFSDWYEFESSAPNAVSHLELDKLLFYPNPATDKMYLTDRYTNKLKDKNVTVLDISGKTVVATTLNKQNVLDISSLKPGNYLLQLNELNKSFQFIKK